MTSFEIILVTSLYALLTGWTPEACIIVAMCRKWLFVHVNISIIR